MMKKFRNWFIGDYLAKTEDVFERARIELVFDYCVFFWVLGVGFYGNLIANHLWYHFYVITFACIALAMVPFMLKYRHNLRQAANWFFVQQVIVSIAESTIQEFKPDMATGMWVMSFILFMIFIFGVQGGLIRSVVFVAFFIFSLYNYMTGKQLDLGIPDDQQLPNQPFFTLVPFSLCLYIVITFVKTRRAAEHTIEQQKNLLETKNREITDSINYAERIQKAILPSHRIIQNYFPESFVIYFPKDIVSGDFYWITHKDDKVFFAVGDCTGHGVPGSILSVIAQNTLNRSLLAFGHTSPAGILDKTNELMESILSRGGSVINDGMDIALCAYNKKTSTLEYAGAQNPIYFLSKGELKEIKGNKQPIGKFESKVPFANHEIKVNAGDSVYLFSDGIADQFGGPQGKKFKYKRLKEALVSVNDKPHHEQKNSLISSFTSWKGKMEQVDDVCIFGARF